MIISPSISQILRGVIHDMNTSLKQGLADPVKVAQIDTMVGVLGAAAIRADHQRAMVAEETTAILSAAQQFVDARKASETLKEALARFSDTASDEDQYEQASQVLSEMADLGMDAGESLYAVVRELMLQRLDNENKVIGGGFEAAGRG